MLFNETERQSATNQVFNIQNLIHKFTGVLGNVNGSQVNVHNFGSIYQLLKDANVSRAERNQLEEILEKAESASPAQRKALNEESKQWVARNKELLGVGAEIVTKVIRAALES